MLILRVDTAYGRIKEKALTAQITERMYLYVYDQEQVGSRLD